MKMLSLVGVSYAGLVGVSYAGIRGQSPPLVVWQWLHGALCTEGSEAFGRLLSGRCID